MLLLALVPHVAQLAQQTCALADPPFRVRAVRKREGIWTADVFLRSTWLPGANVSLRWSSVAPPTASTRGLVHHANHANITKRYTDGVDFTLHETLQGILHEARRSSAALVQVSRLRRCATVSPSTEGCTVSPAACCAPVIRIEGWRGRGRETGRRACKYVWVCQGLYGHVGIRIQQISVICTVS